MAAKDPARLKIPKTEGAIVDRLYAVRAKRLLQQKVVDLLHEEEVALQNAIIELLPAKNLTGIVGKTAKAVVKTESIPQVKDWDLFYKYVHKNKAYDLLQKRLTIGAAKERQDDGVALPGVVNFINKKISLTKI